MEEEKITEIRESVINQLAKERPNLVELILIEGYLATAIAVSDGKTQEVYYLIDFTSKQKDHLHDLENYTLQLYNGFNKPFSMC